MRKYGFTSHFVFKAFSFSSLQLASALLGFSLTRLLRFVCRVTRRVMTLSLNFPFAIFQNCLLEKWRVSEFFGSKYNSVISSQFIESDADLNREFHVY